MQEVVPINTTDGTDRSTRVARALSAEDGSVRLQAALAAGTHPDPAFLEALVGRCAVEPDFFVRDMLSWALTRLSPEVTLPRVRRELGAERAQARSQALHTLSKIGDRSAWAWITRGMLRDADDEVARPRGGSPSSSYPRRRRRTWPVNWPDSSPRRPRGAAQSQPGPHRPRGRDGARPGEGVGVPDPEVAAHARATELLRRDPEAGFDAAVEEAKRIVALAPRTPPRPTRRRRGPWSPTRPRRPPSADR